MTMLKNLTQLEHVIENKVCRFVCDHDTPIHFVKESLFQFQKYIGQLEDQAKQQQAEAAKQQEPKKEEPVKDEQQPA
jgi:hypothetical protein